jgi:hypothetical protein
VTGSSLSRLLVGVGVGAVGLGVLVMLVPGAIGLPGVTETLLTPLGVLALVQAARTVRDGVAVSRRRTDLPDAYRTDAATVCGVTLDRAVERSGRRRGGRRHRSRLTRSLRHTVVETLADETGETRARLRARLDDGRWTDDPVAAALFTGEHDPTLVDRTRAMLGLETTFQRRVRRAVAALEQRVAEDRS